VSSRGGQKNNIDESVNQFAEHNYNKSAQAVRNIRQQTARQAHSLSPLSAVMLRPMRQP
jgi:hypothetical protein